MKFNQPSENTTLVGCYKGIKFWVWQHRGQCSVLGDRPFEIRAADTAEVAERGEPDVFNLDGPSFGQLPAIGEWSTVEAILNEAFSVLNSGADFWEWFNNLDVKAIAQNIEVAA